MGPGWHKAACVQIQRLPARQPGTAAGGIKTLTQQMRPGTLPALTLVPTAVINGPAMQITHYRHDLLGPVRIMVRQPFLPQRPDFMG